MEIPFDRERAAALDGYLRISAPESAGSPSEPAPDRTGPDVRRSIQTLLVNLTGVETIDSEIELIEQGLDSMSATELIHNLEEEFGIEIGPEVLFDYPLFDQFAAQIENRIAARKQKGTAPAVTRQAVDKLVTELFFQLTSIDAIDPNIELTDQGLDSLSATELISQLEASLNIEIGPEILFEYPLRDQFVGEVSALANRGRN